MFFRFTSWYNITFPLYSFPSSNIFDTIAPNWNFMISLGSFCYYFCFCIFLFFGGGIASCRDRTWTCSTFVFLLLYCTLVSFETCSFVSLFSFFFIFRWTVAVAAIAIAIAIAVASVVNCRRKYRMFLWYTLLIFVWVWLATFFLMTIMAKVGQ